MENRVRKHVDNLFKTFEKDEKTLDTKEELISNLLERIFDSIENGMSEDESFDKAMDNLGTTSELKSIFNFKSIKDFTFEYSLNSLQASIITAIYLIIGFVFDLWHPGWVIYVVALALSNFKINDNRSYIIPATSLIYVFVGLMWDLWHPTWVVFVVAAAILAYLYKDNLGL